MHPTAADDETLDTFFHGRIRILQKKQGYRFSIDAPLLANFIRIEEDEIGLELGTGTGVISLLLSLRPFRHITAVEIQETLVDLARRNIRLNGLEQKITIIRDDLRNFASEDKFDVVFANPPYLKARTGHLSASVQKSIAKHELKCTISDIMRKTSELLKSTGRSYFIFPVRRQGEFEKAVEENGLKIKTLRFVHPRLEEKPNLFLASCDYSTESKITLPPLRIYGRTGEYTTEVLKIFSGGDHATSLQ